jgi:hypothetical protein
MSQIKINVTMRFLVKNWSRNMISRTFYLTYIINLTSN